MNQLPYCLVLGGGGAKGVYHIGVWQALKEMDIPVNAFIGNSIGAVIAAFLVQGAEQELMDIARSINLQSLVRLHKDKAITEEKNILDHPLSYWQSVYKNIVENRGLDTSPMRNLLESVINEERVRQSGIDFGVTTVNVSDFKPREVFIENIESGQLINYVMASAAFPGFSNPEINGKKYIDGGLYDNIPFTMARRRGYRKIILVDISGIGLNRRPRTEGCETVYIKNSIDMGSAFDFNPEFTQKFWRLGYLDCMRTFGQLSGYKYFLKSTENENQKKLSQENLTALKSLAKKFPESMKHDQRWWLKTLEVCADYFHIDRIKLYDCATLEKEIDNKIAAINDDVQNTIEKHQLDKDSKSSKLLDAFIKDLIDNRKLQTNSFFVLSLIKKFKPSKTLSLFESTLRRLHPELSIIECYINSSKTSKEKILPKLTQLIQPDE